MQVERRALYNSLRMNWLNDNSLKVKTWQVEDYRLLTIDQLFDRLRKHGLPIDKPTFLGFAEQADSPESLTDDFLSDQELDAESHDRIYLLIFELWRRLLAERLCLSVFCDELDHQIFFYDKGDPKQIETIPDVLAQLGVILDENADEGVDPVHVFETVCSGCANNVENFLYDFIADQIDTQNDLYAAELLEEFGDYIKDVKWFNFLRAKLLASSDPQAANEAIRKLVTETAKRPDLEFNFEILASLGKSGDEDILAKLIKNTIPLLQYEEDFQDLLSLTADFYHLLDKEKQEQAILVMLKNRAQVPFESTFNAKDPNVGQFLQIIKK